MFRRIEFINEHRRPEDGQSRFFKSGLMGASSEAVLDAWFDRLRGPDRTARLERPGRTAEAQTAITGTVHRGGRMRRWLRQRRRRGTP